MVAAVARVRKSMADVLGIGTSLLCLVHCIVPLAIVMSGSVAHELTHHWAMDLLFLTVSGIAVFWVSRTHANKETKWGLWITYGILFVSIMLHDYLVFEVLSYIAATGLIAIHTWNLFSSIKRPHSLAVE